MISTAARERRISAAFVAVADTLTTDFDMVDLLHGLVEECTQILHTESGGLMLLDTNGELQLMTSTSEEAAFVEVMQLNASAGPCIECFSTGTAVSVPDIRKVGSEWAEFKRAALDNGFTSAHATPMKLRGQVIGTMNLFSTTRGALSERDAAVAQALTDVATIGILQERIVREVNTMSNQLHRALDSRVLVEQAKGMIAQSQSLDMDAAFAVIRAHARANGLTIREVAEGVCDRSIDMALAGRRAPAHRRSE